MVRKLNGSFPNMCVFFLIGLILIVAFNVNKEGFREGACPKGTVTLMNGTCEKKKDS